MVDLLQPDQVRAGAAQLRLQARAPGPPLQRLRGAAGEAPALRPAVRQAEGRAALEDTERRPPLLLIEVARDEDIARAGRRRSLREAEAVAGRKGREAECGPG